MAGGQGKEGGPRFIRHNLPVITIFALHATCQFARQQGCSAQLWQGVSRLVFTLIIPGTTRQKYSV